MEDSKLVFRQAVERYWNAMCEAANADHARNVAVARANAADTKLKEAAEHLQAVTGANRGKTKYIRNASNQRVIIVSSQGVTVEELMDD